MYNGVIELSSNFADRLVGNMCSRNDSLIKYCSQWTKTLIC
jgi:hypothetical protein